MPPGCGAILARVAPSPERARGWSRELVLPPASWALCAGGERTGAEIVVPGVSRAKGGAVALQVARLIPELRWTVLAGRASEAELQPWREFGATVLPPGVAPEAWLSRARLVLSPTRAETYGLAMAEAAARGIPVVTSSLPGPLFALGDAATYLPTDAPARAWVEAVQGALEAQSVRLQPQAYPEVVERALSLGTPRRDARRAPAEAELLPRPVGRPRVLSVLMAVGPVHRWLAEAVRSVLEQELPEGWRLELLLGIDGCPESLAEARRCATDPRVGIVSMPRPVGTYAVANALLRHAVGELVTRSDADDVQLSGRLGALAFLMAADPRLGMVNSYYSEADPETLRPTKTRNGPADGVWLFRRALLQRLGGWQPWPCAADSELVGRAKALGAGWQIHRAPLYLARTHGAQLTRSSATGRGSEIREALAAWILRRREQYAKGEPVPRVEVESVPGDIEGPLWRDRVWASLAAIPGRREILGRVVESLLPQVDRLNVYLNGWPDVPDCLLGDPRVVVARSQDHGDLGDAGKMFWVDEAPGYHLSCDDDILYPPDYAERVVEGIRSRGGRVVVGYHGVLLRPHVESYRRDRRVFRFGSALEEDTQVHLLGTGVSGWHAPTVRVSRGNFRVPNMADVWLAALGQQKRLPFVCLRREAGWLQDIDCCYLDSIFRHGEQGTGSAKDKGQIEIEVIQSHEPWQLWPPEESRWIPRTMNSDSGSSATLRA